MAINGFDIYVAGNAVISGSSTGAFYWKDGVITHLPDTTGNASAFAVAVSGGDVYVAGTTYYPQNSHTPYTTPTALYPPTGYIVTVWKNGIPMNLPGNALGPGVVHGNGERLYAEYVSGLAISGSDVYVAGGSNEFVQGLDSTYQFARYWKNGVPVNLTKGLVESSGGRVISYPETTGISVAGTDVYVSGAIDGASQNQSLYWKNGEVTRLSQPGSFSRANSIYVTGNDVYVAGYVDSNNTSYATYWKNGARVTLGLGSRGSNANYITVFHGDVYVAGSEDVNGTSYVTYWKNGAANHLGVNGEAYSIAVE
ncbi:hypothetical protein GCM10011511_20430 [Puia dinghuensis]|uniref:Uncharacterized protein n=2 Tax=Puia dinghuensis TaxID=1792502 RepID=A0A8J2XSR2_9BACT|nr:hypothetical protein GCM10011511_20430 [Puia dinghuensis]